MFEDSYRHRGLRRALVKQVREKGIDDEAVLAALGRVPRHLFFDSAFLEHAYEDKAFPIGEGQTISQPYTVAYQTQLLSVQPGEKVLEVGTGSGYQACVLLELGAKVYSIEYNRRLYERTRLFLPPLGYRPELFHGDGSQGLPRYAPYHAILVTAGAPAVPLALVEQLQPGGRLVIPVGDRQTQRMQRLTRLLDGRIATETFPAFSFVPLRGEKGWSGE